MQRIGLIIFLFIEGGDIGMRAAFEGCYSDHCISLYSGVGSNRTARRPRGSDQVTAFFLVILRFLRGSSVISMGLQTTQAAR